MEQHQQQQHAVQTAVEVVAPFPCATVNIAAAAPPPARPAQVQRPPVPPPPVTAAPTKRVGRKGGGRRSAAAAGAQEPEELVMLGPEVSRNSERLRTGWHPVQLSSEDKAAEVTLDDKQLTASSSAGYRMVRATHGACSGTWYYEVRVDRLAPSGAARVGWATRQAEVNGPVGADKYGFSYRSIEGSKVHAAWRDEYGKPYGEDDVVGCLLHMPEGGRPFEKGVADVVKYKSKLYMQDGEPSEPQRLEGSVVAFTLNGELQGTAYGNILEGTYCPAVSLYTNRTAQQQEPAMVTVNFGEHGFAFEPPHLEGCAAAQPAFLMAGPRPGQAPLAVQQGQQGQQHGAAEEQQQQVSTGQPHQHETLEQQEAAVHMV